VNEEKEREDYCSVDPLRFEMALRNEKKMILKETIKGTLLSPKPVSPFWGLKL